MDVLHLNTKDTSGGAARAAYRLHGGLRDHGVESRMLVQEKHSDDNTVYGTGGTIGAVYGQIRRRMDELPTVRYRDRTGSAFSPAWIPERREAEISAHDPDVVNLHWVTQGFLRPETIAEISGPIVWTLHDMWPFTGGCHYSGDCTKYETECGGCPLLGSSRSDDLSHSVWWRKHDAFADAEITVVAPSSWLAGCARSSSLFADVSVQVIPNGIDTDSFKPRDRALGLERFGLDPGTRYVLFGVDYETPRKGGDLLREATETLSGSGDIALLTFGDATVESGLSLPVYHLGHLSERELRVAYSTADVTAVPSREDNLPNIAVESLASGTPCVAFETGGLPDIVTHRETGYLARPFAVDELARGIEWILADADRLDRLSRSARANACEQFALETVADRYVDLYESVL